MYEWKLPTLLIPLKLTALKFLMDSSLTLPVPEKITLAQASTIGVCGSYTAGLGVFYCLDIPVPDPENLPLAKDEWVLVLGGASSVGKLTVQVWRSIPLT